ncbi:MAG: hypothetical protein ABIY62_03015 [Ginsengibacter sp.]
MKKTYFILILAFACFSCHSTSDKKARADSIETYHQVGVPNTNGGIPDTTNSIDLTHKLDTISNKKIDTVK